MGIATNKFSEGDQVRYIPNHANGDIRHRDCENGVVSSVGTHYVFVRYERSGGVGQATSPHDLVLMTPTACNDAKAAS